MRRRSSADPSAKHRDANSTTDHPPQPDLEHDDKLNHHLEALQLKASNSTDREALLSPEPQLPTAYHSTHDPAPTTRPQSRIVPAKAHAQMAALAKDIIPPSPGDRHGTKWRQRLRNPWTCSLTTLATTMAAFVALFLMTQAFLFKQQDVKGCGMSYMRPTYTRFNQFDTEHTRFATKYSLYLYREGSLDDDSRVKGVPVLFIPGNAGSYKQVRSLAAEAAYHYHNHVHHDVEAGKAGKRPLDFFSVDFNEDITAFHGQTLLDQAEYLNDAIAYILSLYHTPGKFHRDSTLPDPTSVIIVGHSMGGVVARTMLTMPNYQANTINTIITLAAPPCSTPSLV